MYPHNIKLPWVHAEDFCHCVSEFLNIFQVYVWNKVACRSLCTGEKSLFEYCVIFSIIGTSERNIWPTNSQGVETEKCWEMHAIPWTSNKRFLKHGCQHITSEKRKERAFLSQDLKKKDKYKCPQSFLDVLNCIPSWKQKSFKFFWTLSFSKKKLCLLTATSLIILTWIVLIYINKITKTQDQGERNEIAFQGHPVRHQHHKISTLYFLTLSFSHPFPHRITWGDILNDYKYWMTESQ